MAFGIFGKIIFPSSWINSEPWDSSSADLFISISRPLLCDGGLKISRLTGGQVSVSVRMATQKPHGAWGRNGHRL